MMSILAALIGDNFLSHIIYVYTTFIIFREERGVKLMAVIGDFGLATRIPKKDSPRLPQVKDKFQLKYLGNITYIRFSVIDK